jgi:hypothetical protein
LRETEAAIRERIGDEPSVAAQLKARHAAAVQAGRTAGSAAGYTSFSDDAITQAAAHWLLGCVFVRFLEDNGWLDDRNRKVAWIAGPSDRLAIAKDQRTLFLRPNPELTDRDYLLHVFAEIAKLPGIAGLFDPRHNPLYSLQPTAQGAAKIVQFFQKFNLDSNQLEYDFSDPSHGTRFLGDLYQNLSESARKRYALLQTPGFVIDFILDRTLTPALDAFGLETVRMIDPACGSGHFLLEAFARLLRLWRSREPATNPPALVQKALDAVYGVDLNPFAIEITRFRLLIAALESSGIERLKDAPNFAFNLAAGDSLLHGERIGGGGIQRGLLEDRMEHYYDAEDAAELHRILSQPYHVVVGNPPYINVSDPVLREAYRSRFSTCHGKYQLGVPFTERFFDLTLGSNSREQGPAGWVGMIVSNAFMKRSFGKKLIENYLRHLDLTHVIDAGGVYLPGHGTPTTILFGRHQAPVSTTIRAVRGIHGETGVPEDPANAPVWREIVDHIDQAGFEGIRVSVADAPRTSFEKHPWSVGGGGAAELKEGLEQASASRLSARILSSGPASFPGQGEAFEITNTVIRRFDLDCQIVRGIVAGDNIREWHSTTTENTAAPYDEQFNLKEIESLPSLARFMWPNRHVLRSTVHFGGLTLEEIGHAWWAWYRWIPERYRTALSIVVGEIATHNHFVLDRGGKVFNQTAPVIKLPTNSTEDQHLELLGLLNSSSGCFWLKQVCFPKGGDTVGKDGARVRKLMWDVYYAFDGTKLKQFPIPEEKPLDLTKLIQAEADARSALFPHKLCLTQLPTYELLSSARDQAWNCLGRMIALQEELDWQCYRLYGIVDEELTLSPDQVPKLNLGERAFEIVMARANEEPLWFERHGSTTITGIPSHWPEAYRQLVEKRIALIESNRDIALIERPEYKRRWNLPSWREMESAALKSWLLDRMEANPIWQEHRLVSCAQLRDALSRDDDWVSVADLYNGAPVEDLEGFVARQATPEAVPFLPILRYTESGLRKRAEWEEVWRLQREEDAGQQVNILVPPKYVTKDFQKGDYWRLRGGLDVPKERFILYSGLERDSDRTPVLGWAGWNHLEQARALATYYQSMRTEEGWEAERLKPTLAGVLDLKPWLLQWHNEFDPETGVKLGEYFSQFAESQCQELGFSPEEVRAWQPNSTTGPGRRTRRRSQ